jgi:hypothetical protein
MHVRTGVKRGAVIAGLVALAVSGARAHHSFAVYDHTKTVMVKGTVTKFQWTNPHAFIELDVPGNGGAVTHYSIECTSINMMSRLGWRSNMIKAGDQVKATVAPLLNGQPGGLLLDIILPDGTRLEPGVPNIASFKRSADAE